MKNAVRYAALGLLIGDVLTVILYFLGAFVECQCYCFSFCSNEGRPFIKNFWPWDRILSYFFIITVGCSIVGFFYGLLANDKAEDELAEIHPLIVVLYLVVLYLATYFIRGFALG